MHVMIFPMSLKVNRFTFSEINSFDCIIYVPLRCARQTRVLEQQLLVRLFCSFLLPCGMNAQLKPAAVTQAPQLSGQWDSLASCSCLSLRFRFSLIVKPLGGQSLKGVYGTPSDATRPLHTICH